MQNFSKEELISQIKDLQEQLQKIKKQKKYGIVWEEKAENIDKNKLPMLEEDKELRIENDKNKPQNLIIEWDNFHALSVLQNTHKGKVDVIYIDPPYNTGDKDFIYNDDYVDKEDTYRHSKWLSFMQKRLVLAKNLLKNDWVIFISIDEHEMFNLKLLCDEIFGEKNFIENFIWHKNSTKNLSKTTSTNHEYILCYALNKEIVLTKNFFREGKKWYHEVMSLVQNLKNQNFQPKEAEKELKNFYKNNPDLKWISMYNMIDENWNIFTSSDASAPKSTWVWNTYDVIHPVTGKVCKLPSTWWRYTFDTMQEHLKNWNILFWKDETTVPRFKRKLENVETEVKKSIIMEFSDWKKDLQKIFEVSPFDNPKPEKLIKNILSTFWKDIFVIDFFAGSGTTGHAVMELNKEDWWNRQFILCSNRENTKENPEKNICRDITYERNKRVIQGYTNAKWEQIKGLGGNLRYYKTTFINKNPSIDDLRYSFIHKCDDLLCIKENTFTKVSFGEEIEEIKIFHNKNHFTVILYDMLYFAKAKEILELFPDKKISFYAFSMSKTMIAEEIAHIWKNIVLENIPDEILETYEKIFGL